MYQSELHMCYTERAKIIGGWLNGLHRFFLGFFLQNVDFFDISLCRADVFRV